MGIEHLLPSLWLIFAAFLLLFFSCISGSAWSEVSFLNVQIDGRNIYFGVFGYTGISQPTWGYNISQAVGPINKATDNFLGGVVLSRLEMVLIIHLLTTILVFIAWAIMFWRRDVGKKARLLGKVKEASFVLAAIGTLFLFIFDMAVFATVMNLLRSNGISADLGNANWITLGAAIALLIEPCWVLLEPTLPEAWQRRPTATSGTGTEDIGA